jgi:hypothetical protein
VKSKRKTRTFVRYALYAKTQYRLQLIMHAYTLYSPLSFSLYLLNYCSKKLRLALLRVDNASRPACSNGALTELFAILPVHPAVSRLPVCSIYHYSVTWILWTYV